MKKSSFVEGTVIATLAIVITKILGMLYVIPFYAIIGVQGASLYAYAYNIYVIFLDISSAGLPTAISKVINEFNTLGDMEGKVRAYRLGKELVTFLSVIVFILLFVFAPQISTLILGDLQGGNTIFDVTIAIRCVSFALLVIPYLSVSRGYLQGHNIINVSSISQVIEQIIRILFILLGSYLALHIFHLPLTTAVGIAVFGACAGGIGAAMYVGVKIQKNRKELNLDCTVQKDTHSSKKILKRILIYAIPFIVISVASSLYHFVDMVFLSRTLNFLHFDAYQVEFITTSITTWSNKISMIVTSIAMGMSVSLIPNIVEAFTLKKWNIVNFKLNKALEIIFVVCLPMAIGLSLLANAVWSIFFGYNELGASILAVFIFPTVFYNLYTITSMTLQSVNQFKAFYFTTILGLFLNAVLDIPFMILLHHFGIPAWIGAGIATVIGYATSTILSLWILKRDHHLGYGHVFSLLGKMIVPILSMICVVLVLRILIPVNYTVRLSCVFYVGVISLLGGFVYLFLSYKMGILEDVFGKEYIQKIVKKLTFGKISF